MSLMGGTNHPYQAMSKQDWGASAFVLLLGLVLITAYICFPSKSETSCPEAAAEAALLASDEIARVADQAKNTLAEAVTVTLPKED